MNSWLRFAGVVSMTLLAGGILILMGTTFNSALAHMGADGKVPLADAGLFTALLLSFREVLAVVKSIWEYADRSEATGAISNSTPAMRPNPPTDDTTNAPDSIPSGSDAPANPPSPE